MLKRNTTGYKEKKNLLGDDFKVLKCFNCQSEYYFAKKWNKKKKDIEENKEDGAMLT